VVGQNFIVIALETFDDFSTVLARNLPSSQYLAPLTASPIYLQRPPPVWRRRQASDLIVGLRCKIHSSGSFGHEKWEINEMVKCLHLDVAEITSQLTDLELLKSKLVNSQLVVHILRQKLVSLRKDFDVTVQERRAKLAVSRNTCRAYRYFGTVPKLPLGATYVPLDAVDGPQPQVLQEVHHHRFEVVRTVDDSITQIARVFSDLPRTVVSWPRTTRLGRGLRRSFPDANRYIIPNFPPDWAHQTVSGCLNVALFWLFERWKTEAKRQKQQEGTRKHAETV
jgi:hypothetical protein